MLKKLKLRNARASILFVFGPLFRGVPHLAKYIERKERHPLLLVGAQSLVKRLPRTGELLIAVSRDAAQFSFSNVVPSPIRTLALSSQDRRRRKFAAAVR